MKNPASRLTPCPRTPNCISSLAPPGRQHTDPLPYAGSKEQTRQRLLAVLRGLPRTRLTAEEPDYLHAECRSLVFRFVDDVEFALDDTARVVHVRSASRLGRNDFGVNRQRIEEIRRLYLAAGS